MVVSRIFGEPLTNLNVFKLLTIILLHSIPNRRSTKNELGGYFYMFWFRDDYDYIIIKGTKTEDDEGERDTLAVATYREILDKKPSDYLNAMYGISFPASYSQIFDVTGTGMYLFSQKRI